MAITVGVQLEFVKIVRFQMVVWGAVHRMLESMVLP